MRVDTHVYEGYDVPPNYDSLIAKIIVHDADRPAALARASRALGELEIEGISTTRELFLEMLQDAPIREGRYTTGYLAEAAPRLSKLGSGA